MDTSLEFLQISKRQLQIIFKIFTMIIFKWRRGCCDLFHRVTTRLSLSFKISQSTYWFFFVKQSSNWKNSRTIIRWYDWLTSWDLFLGLRCRFTSWLTIPAHQKEWQYQQQDHPQLIAFS